MLVWYYYTGLLATNKCLYCTITQDQLYTQYMLVQYDFTRDQPVLCICLYGTISLETCQYSVYA